jgi:CheY-like chemotaxis protein
MSNYTMNILLVEDDDVAAEAVVRSLRKHEMDFPITLAQDGLEALEILRGQHPELTIESPYISLLDLNMPRMNGLEFLKAIRADEKLSSSVIFVLTTSDADADRQRAYQANIAGYMVKSAVGTQFEKLANLLEQYRITVKLPNQPKDGHQCITP